MNQFDELSKKDQEEVLANFIPSWEKAPLEPFLSSAQQDVQPPTWRPILEAGQASVTGTSGGADLALFECVIGVSEGGSFVPKLANVVGPLRSIP